MNTNLRGVTTRQHILIVARSAVLAKGFDATSIKEIVAEVDIAKSGFFYHFPDKSALARALIEEFVTEENRLFDGIFARPADLADDPLEELLIGLRPVAEPMGRPAHRTSRMHRCDRLLSGPPL